ncbi:MAG: TlpA family protein disulfide reductase [bacterium]|nr:TlpA family protein disulfide reductase [bacterium]
MRHLQQIHTTYGDKGVVVLGLNYADDEAIAREFLKDSGATFPTILDASPAARQVLSGYENIGSAVPLTYIIDPEGKVAGAWYGYRRGHAEGIRLLRQLGVE